MENIASTDTLTWENAPAILTVMEAAQLARIPRNAAYEAVRQGIIPSVNLGSRRIRIAKAVLAKVLALDGEREGPPSIPGHRTDRTPRKDARR